MQFKFELPWDVEATFIERPNRFLCTALIDDGKEERKIEAHVHDPGRMKELLLPNARLRLRFRRHLHFRKCWHVSAQQRPGATNSPTAGYSLEA